MTVELEPITTTIERARDLVARPHGWTKGNYMTTHFFEESGTFIEAYCSIGAINHAIYNALTVEGDALIIEGNDEYNYRTLGARLDRRALLYAYLREAAKITDEDIVNWNDAPQRSQDEVIAAFDKTLALAKAEAEKWKPTN